MDFFQITTKHIKNLSRNEIELYNYIIHNMEEVKKMTIRDFAAKCYSSPATIIRFLRKIGFSGYSDFISILKYMDPDIQENYNPFLVTQEKYRAEYLKNIYESVRVLDIDKVDEIINYLNENPRLVVMARGLNKSVAHYFEYLFSGLGFEVAFPEDHYFRKMLINGIRDSDLVFVFSYGGEDKELIENIEQVKVRTKATVISITSANNNSIQNLSHYNLYIFADFLKINTIDLTSRVSMICLIEMLAYRYIEQNNQFESRIPHYE
ncbi:MurR/RpiR family transcriptional regulator [Weizmannia sp. FSL W8-0401]|uniref:MurR/RpiR family transcriptional regulator n=1 Tax=Weizmannia sp. FSL W8-0401 TaxID=2954554 RepID=UPI0030FC2FFA